MNGYIRNLTVISLLCASSSLAWGEGKQFLYTPQPVTQGESTVKEGILVREIEVKPGDTLHNLSQQHSGNGRYYPQILLFNHIKNPNRIYAGSTIRVPIGKNGTTPVVESQVKRETAGGKTSIDESAEVRDLKTAATAAADDSAETPLTQKTEPPVKKKRQTKKEINSTSSEAVKTEPKIAKPASSAGVNTELSLSELKGAASVTKSEGRKKKTTFSKKSKSPDNSAVAYPADRALYDAAMKAFNQNDHTSAIELFDRLLKDYSNSPLTADASLYKAESYMKLSEK